MSLTATPPDDQAPADTLDPVAVGRRIAQARREAGAMTQETLAELLCVCRRSVQAYESGRRVPYRHVHRLAEIFERPASWFLHGDTGEDAAAPEPDDEVMRRLDAQAKALARLVLEVAALRRSLDSGGR